MPSAEVQVNPLAVEHSLQSFDTFGVCICAPSKRTVATTRARICAFQAIRLNVFVGNILYGIGMLSTWCLVFFAFRTPFVGLATLIFEPNPNSFRECFFGRPRCPVRTTSLQSSKRMFAYRRSPSVISVTSSVWPMIFNSRFTARLKRFRSRIPQSCSHINRVALSINTIVQP